MAVDTANKRGSCIGFATPPRRISPVPDGSLANQADRQQMAYSYPGILAGAAAVLIGREFTVSSHRRLFTVTSHGREFTVSKRKREP